MQHKIAVIGSANADLVLDIDRRPQAGETLLGSDAVVTPGGKGANQAVAAALLGGDVAFVGAVGDDPNAAMLRHSLTDAGVDVAALDTVPGASGVAIIMVTPDGENSIIVSPAANRRVTPERLAASETAWSDAVVLVLQLEIPLETVALAATTVHRAGGRVVLNAAPAVHLPAEVLTTADPLVVNETEAAFLLGGAPADPQEVATALLGLGPRSVVVTLGEQGARYAERSEYGASGGVPTPSGSHGWVPAHRVAAVDTTGAGDAFVGALAVELAAGASLAGAVTFATAVAAVTVSRRGAQAAYPRRAEVAP
ncbi:MAG: ribokinase [Georgenia sp.]